MESIAFKFPVNSGYPCPNGNWDGPGSRCYGLWIRPRISLYDYLEQLKRGNTVVYYSLEMSASDVEARMLALMGDYLSPKYEHFSFKYGSEKSAISKFADCRVIGDIHLSSSKKAFPESRKTFIYTLGKYL